VLGFQLLLSGALTLQNFDIVIVLVLDLDLDIVIVLDLLDLDIVIVLDLDPMNAIPKIIQKDKKN